MRGDYAGAKAVELGESWQKLTMANVQNRANGEAGFLVVQFYVSSFDEAGNVQIPLNSAYEITDVKLELGEVATPPLRRDHTPRSWRSAGGTTKK